MGCGRVGGGLPTNAYSVHHSAQAFALLSNDVTWDTHGVLLSGRDAMRVMVGAGLFFLTHLSRTMVEQQLSAAVACASVASVLA